MSIETENYANKSQDAVDSDAVRCERRNCNHTRTRHAGGNGACWFLFGGEPGSSIYCGCGAFVEAVAKPCIWSCAGEDADRQHFTWGCIRPGGHDGEHEFAFKEATGIPFEDSR